MADGCEQVIEKAKHRSSNKTLFACSLPFQGRWFQGISCLIPDVSIPTEWKEALSSLEKL